MPHALDDLECLFINCPTKRIKLAESKPCGSMVVIGGSGIGYCSKCRIFYSIHKEFGINKVRAIAKEKIKFVPIPFKLLT